MRSKRQQKGAAMGVKLNLALGSKGVKAHNFDISLDPNIIRIVKILARQAAEEDFQKAIDDNKH